MSYRIPSFAGSAEAVAATQKQEVGCCFSLRLQAEQQQQPRQAGRLLMMMTR